MITELVNKIKGFLEGREGERFLLLIVYISSVLLAYFLGGLSHINPAPAVKITPNKTPISSEYYSQKTLTFLEQATIVASKNGGFYYHLYCDGASKIQDENRVYFIHKDDAESAGLQKAPSCAAKN